MVVPSFFVLRECIRTLVLAKRPSLRFGHIADGRSPLRPAGLFFGTRTITKSELRKTLRNTRREHVAAQPDSVRGLLFNMPPRPLLAHINASATIGLYHSTEFEAPTAGYARFFYEAGHQTALPHFVHEAAAMEFREHTDPLGESDLEPGPFGLVQPGSDAGLISPDIVFVPLLGFTEKLDRLGQGRGHYDRWLAAHPETKAIGLAWDVQLREELPLEPHDMKLDGVITPTRMYGIG